MSNATLASLGSKRVVTYTTPSAVGGLVKSRRFLDCSQETEAAGGALIGWCCDWTGDDAEHEALFDGLVRGRNLVGGGTAVKKLGESWQLTMIGFTDLGGGLPATIANSASVGAFPAHRRPRDDEGRRQTRCRHRVVQPRVLAPSGLGTVPS